MPTETTDTAVATLPWPADVEPLVQIYSRGFTGGMYGGRAGRGYVTREHPDNRGRELGTVALNWGITTQRIVFTAKPINGLADLKGMKLRINTTPAFKDFYQLLGAAPTPIPTPAVFDAMANGRMRRRGGRSF